VAIKKKIITEEEITGILVSVGRVHIMEVSVRRDLTVAI